MRKLRAKAGIAPWRKVSGGAQRWGVFPFYNRFLGLPRVRPDPGASVRLSGLCAWGSTVIRLHAWQSKFILDGEGTSAPLPQRGQRSPGLVVGDSVRWLMPGKLSHPSPAGDNRPRSDSPPAEGQGWRWQAKGPDIMLSGSLANSCSDGAQPRQPAKSLRRCSHRQRQRAARRPQARRRGIYWALLNRSFCSAASSAKPSAGQRLAPLRDQGEVRIPGHHGLNA